MHEFILKWGNAVLQALTITQNRGMPVHSVREAIAIGTMLEGYAAPEQDLDDATVLVCRVLIESGACVVRGECLFLNLPENPPVSEESLN